MPEAGVQFLRPADLAPQFGVSPGRIYQMLRAGELPFVRVGGSIRIPRAALEAWLAEQTTKALAAVRRSEPGHDDSGAEALRP